MFKIGDRVEYVGLFCIDFTKWFRNRPGIIIKIDDNLVKVEYEKKNTNTFWFKKSELKHAIPDYIRIWEKQLDV